MLQIKNKDNLSILYVFLVLLVITISISSIWQVKGISKESNNIVNNWMPSVKELDDIKLIIYKIRSQELNYMLATNEELEILENQQAELISKLRENEKKYESLITETEERIIYSELKKDINIFLKNDKDILLQLKKNRKKEALQMLNMESFNHYNIITINIEKLIKINQEGANKSESKINCLSYSVIVGVIWAGLVVVVLMLLLL